MNRLSDADMQVTSGQANGNARMASGLHEERFPTATCLAIACSQTCMNPDLRDTSIFSANTIFVGHPGRIRAENENSKTLQSMATFQ